MKTLNYKLLLLLLFISSVIYSCSNEDSLIPSPPPPIENNVITRSNGVVLDMPYISRPDLDNTSHKDTTDMWILYIRTDIMKTENMIMDIKDNIYNFNIVK